MPTPTAYELYNSRHFIVGKDSQEGTLEYIVYGIAEDGAARTLLLDTAPKTFPGIAGLVRGDVRISTLGGLLWYATIPYLPDYAPEYPSVGIVGPPEPVPPAPGMNTPLGADFAFDLTAQTEKIYQSLATVSRTKRGGGQAPDTKGAIGISADGEVKGCDKFMPHLEWATSKTFTSITMDYLRQLSELVGTTNNAPFYGYATNTNMFMGASGNTKDVGKCVVTFKFAYKKNRTSIPICDGLTVPAKKGWEYLWVAYKNVEDQMQLTQQPDAAYVEKIYEEANYGGMGIG